MNEGEPSGETLDRHLKLSQWLVERGWEQADAMEYVALHSIWLQTELSPAEAERAKSYEENNGVPEFLDF